MDEDGSAYVHPLSLKEAVKMKGTRKKRETATSILLSIDQEAEKRKKRKLKLDTLLHAGCGYGRAKKRLLKAFWEALWPALVEHGWTEINGQGDDDGSINFIRPGIDVRTGQKGSDYYDKIKEVITVVEKNARFFSQMPGHNAEKRAAEAYQKSIEFLEALDAKSDLEKKEEKFHGARRLACRTQRDGASWKHNRKHYPRMSCRVGEEYQATNLPTAVPFAEVLHGKKCGQPDYEAIWSPQLAEQANEDLYHFIERKVPKSKRESAMILLHQHSYETGHVLEELEKQRPMDGSDWSREARTKFSTVLFDTRKDFSIVSKAIEVPVGICLCYYYGTYKGTDNYVILKHVSAKDRRDEAPSHDDSCSICGQGGNLLCCDSCDNVYHLNCLIPRLTTLPEGRWDCEACVNRKFAMAGKSLLENLLILPEEEEATPANAKSDPQDLKSSGSSTMPDVTSRQYARTRVAIRKATNDFLNAIRKFT